MNTAIRNGLSIEFLTKVPIPKTFIKKLFLQLYHKLWRVTTVRIFIYSNVAHPIYADKLFILGTVFAYGQTGSGKTFTMRGTDSCPGIIPLAVRSLLDVMKEKQDREFMMAMIYIEIYNEKIKDLLCSKEDKKIIITDKDGQFDVEGVEQKVVATSEEIMRLLALGDKKRATAATNMNEHSSR